MLSESDFNRGLRGHTEDDPDDGGDRHRQRSPEADTKYGFADRSPPAYAESAPSEPRKMSERIDTLHEIQRTGDMNAVASGNAAPMAKVKADVNAA